MDSEKQLQNTENELDFEDEKIKNAIEKYGYLNKQDPYSSANFFSHIFLFWAFRIIKLGNLVTLKSEYFGKLKGKFSSQHFLKRIKEVWETKGFKLKKSLPLVQAAIYSNLCNFIIILVMNIFKALLNMISIDIFREYMKRFGMTQEEIDKDKNIYSFLSQTAIGLICLFIKFFEVFYIRYCSKMEMNLIVTVCAQLQGLLFDKLLKASPSSMKERAEIGQITNFLENDSQKLTQLMIDCPNVFTIPINLIGFCFLLFKFLGISFLFGVATLLLCIFINVCVVKRMQKLIEKICLLKDRRIKAIIEAIDNIKIIKLYAWEGEFKNRIDNAREKELKILAQTFKIININFTVAFLSPIAISIVSIGTYQLFYDYLKIEDIMASFNIFSSMQQPIEQIPKILNDFNEVSISMKRIQDYLFQDEINPGNIIRNSKIMETSGLSIKIENGNFSWGIPPKAANQLHLEDLKQSGITLDEEDDMNKGEKLLQKNITTKEDTTFLDNENIIIVNL